MRKPSPENESRWSRTTDGNFAEALLRRIGREEKNTPKAFKLTSCLCSSRLS